jgi:hypothetical protein
MAKKDVMLCCSPQECMFKARLIKNFELYQREKMFLQEQHISFLE